MRIMQNEIEINDLARIKKIMKRIRRLRSWQFEKQIYDARYYRYLLKDVELTRHYGYYSCIRICVYFKNLKKEG